MSAAHNTQQSLLKTWSIAVFLLRVFTMIFLLSSIIVLATNTTTLTINFRSAHLRFKDVYAYRYLLSTAVVGLAYTLLQIPFAAYFVTTGKRMTSGFGFLLFDFVADKGVTLVLATGVGAGFGATLDLKKVIDDLEKVLERNGLFNIAEPLNKLDRFFDLGSASTGLLLMAFLFMVAQSVLSSLALCKRVSANELHLSPCI